MDIHTSKNSKIGQRNEDHNITTIVQKRARVLMKVITHEPVSLSAKSANFATYLGIKDQVSPEFANQKSKDARNQKQKEVGLIFYGHCYKYYLFSVLIIRYQVFNVPRTVAMFLLKLYPIVFQDSGIIISFYSKKDVFYLIIVFVLKI